MKGTLYGVGVGPGDPELLTLKAVRIIRESEVIALPDSGGTEEVALSIARQHIGDRAVLRLSMPMTRDKAVAAASHQAAARQLTALLEEGKDVAFLTLGDPSVYSTYLYLHRLVLGAGYDARMVPGVPSFCAAAAALNTGLCEGREALHVIPGSYDGLEQALDLGGTKVLMKSGGQLGEVFDRLAERKLLDKAALVERCGLPGERVVRQLGEHQDRGYFTTVIVKE